MGLFSRKPKAKISGEYFSSHPKIKGHHKKLYLIATDEGIAVHGGGTWGMDKAPVTTLAWSEVTGFEYDTNTDENESRRVSATRVTAVGVFALAAKKKQLKIESKTVATLHTATGDIELETKLKDGGFSSTVSSATLFEIAAIEKANKNFRIFVANHAN